MTETRCAGLSRSETTSVQQSFVIRNIWEVVGSTCVKLRMSGNVRCVSKTTVAPILHSDFAQDRNQERRTSDSVF